MTGFKIDQQAPLVDGVKPYLEWAVSRRADERRLESGLARKILKGQERRPERPMCTRRRGCTVPANRPRMQLPHCWQNSTELVRHDCSGQQQLFGETQEPLERHTGSFLDHLDCQVKRGGVGIPPY